MSPHPRLVNQLRWYFKQRQAKIAEGKPVDDQEAYDEAHFAFRAVRYQVLFNRWLREGDAAFEAVSSPVTADAINRGAGHIEYYVLPFSYRHLSPLVGSTRPQTKGAEEGEDARTRPRPPLGSVRCAVDANAEVRVEVHA